MLLRQFSLTSDPLLTDVTEESDQVPSPESPATEEVPEQTPKQTTAYLTLMDKPTLQLQMKA